MSNFDESQIRRGQPDNAGKFRVKENSAPEGELETTTPGAALLSSVVDWLPESEPWRNDRDRLARIMLSMTTLQGDSDTGATVKASGPEAALDEVYRTDARMLPQPQLVANTIALARKNGIDLMTPQDAGWPSQLDDLGDRTPYALWTRGDISLLGDKENLVAVEGARASTGYGEQVTKELADGLVGAGKTTVTGGAFGIAGTAVRATLAAGGKTISVLASGPERYYPAAHQSLLEKVESQGLVVSECAPGMGPTKKRFVERQRIIAALAGRTVIVEAGHRSGALGVAREAALLGRDVCAVPGPVTSAASGGTNALIAEGTARLVTGSEDVLR